MWPCCDESGPLDSGCVIWVPGGHGPSVCFTVLLSTGSTREAPSALTGHEPVGSEKAHSLIYSLIHSFAQSFIRSVTHSLLVHSFTQREAPSSHHLLAVPAAEVSREEAPVFGRVTPDTEEPASFRGGKPRMQAPGHRPAPSPTLQEMCS